METSKLIYTADLQFHMHFLIELADDLKDAGNDQISASWDSWQLLVQAVHCFCPLLPNRNVRLGLRQNFNFYSANLSLAKWANCDSAL